MSNKKSFVMYADTLDVLDELSKDQIADLFLAIKDYQSGIEPTLNGVLKIAFLPFKQSFDRDKEKWENTRKARAQAGSKGGKAKVANAKLAKQNKQNVANVAVNVNDNVNVNVNGNVTKEILSNDNICTLPSAQKVDYQKIIDWYHELLPELPACKILSEARKKAIKARTKKEFKNDIDNWQKYFTYIRNNCTWMLTGEYNINLDYIIRQSEVIKIIEGAKNDKQQGVR